MRRLSLPALVVAALGLALARCGPPDAEAAPYAPPPLAIDPVYADTATFAGGCFWCMEGPFERIPGVASAVSGFTGGREPNPTYDDVANGRTSHAEAVQIVYDERRVSYARLLSVFWHNIDPLQSGGQFCDRGTQYRSAVFYHDAEQRRLAEATRGYHARRFGQPIATQIVPVGAFTPAEAYHQDFYRTHPQRYREYRAGCGRDARLRELWGREAGH